jgi:hypothetical protein
MRDMVSQSNSSVPGTRRDPLGGIKLAGKRLRGWIEGRAARAAEAALYQQLSLLSDVELERRGIRPGSFTDACPGVRTAQRAGADKSRNHLGQRAFHASAGCNAIGGCYVRDVCGLQRHSPGGVPAANPQGGKGPERRILGVMHDLDAVPPRTPFDGRLRARQSLRLVVGPMLREQCSLLHCHLGGGELEASQLSAGNLQAVGWEGASSCFFERAWL